NRLAPHTSATRPFHHRPAMKEWTLLQQVGQFRPAIRREVQIVIVGVPLQSVIADSVTSHHETVQADCLEGGDDLGQTHFRVHNSESSQPRLPCERRRISSGWLHSSSSLSGVPSSRTISAMLASRYNSSASSSVEAVPSSKSRSTGSSSIWGIPLSSKLMVWPPFFLFILSLPKETVCRHSRLAQHEIDDPTAAHMLAGLTAVIQNVGVGAARFFQSVGQDGQTVESTLLVNRLSQPWNGI